MRLDQTHRPWWLMACHYDLPLASLLIRAGVNQMIMLSLAKVSVASLIETKRFVKSFPEAFQYAYLGLGFFWWALPFCFVQ